MGNVRIAEGVFTLNVRNPVKRAVLSDSDGERAESKVS